MSRRPFRTNAGTPVIASRISLHTWPDPLLRRATTRPGRRAHRPGKVEQVRTLGLVQLQRTRERLQDALGDPVQVPPLQTGVVVHTHTGEQRDFLPAKSGKAPASAEGRQARLLRDDPGPPRSQELANLVPVVHDLDATATQPPWEGLSVPGLTGTPTPPPSRVSLPLTGTRTHPRTTLGPARRCCQQTTWIT
jgi:hypothetical protein